MKKLENFKNYKSFLNESYSNPEAMVTLDMASETLANWATTLSEMAKIAPNCVFVSFDSVTADYWDVTISGSFSECQALADYWNDLKGADEVVVEPFR